ncbi:MAG: SMP-30/gluconolactonase/LRE family protein [Lactobacillus sp.]|jgi:sugar lactone lactonase YvrE|nr:MAG: SMP-30/gluconolactonase/LRE family protein [Lactobacillus sp.]
MAKNNIEILCELKNAIGECPVYDPDKNNIYWVDIVNKTFLKYSLSTKKLKQYNAGKYDSYIILGDKGGVYLGMQDGLYKYDFEKNQPELLGAPVPYDIYSHRFNDGKADVNGIIWAGTTSFFEGYEHCELYRIDHDFNYRKVLSNVIVSNGLAWSPNNTIFYYIDSFTKLIYKFDFDKETSSISNQKLFIDFNENGEIGNPDGMTVDNNGNLWIAHWGGSRVTCWDHQTGKKLDEIVFPNKIVTCPIFVEDSLILTTATLNYTDNDFKQESPFAGSLLRVNVGVSGVPSFKIHE